ncbi:Large polyvalent protein-associated domain-containing protein [Vibrio crassostreae]|nr:Large polyvalent protein-associated domain-containing protein [Vibrio crassostreae]CAK3225226.1 Large polyvalent protein-associated domain-containing protein [Vibrio crassostreae]
MSDKKEVLSELLENTKIDEGFVVGEKSKNDLKVGSVFSWLNNSFNDDYENHEEDIKLNTKRKDYLKEYLDQKLGNHSTNRLKSEYYDESGQLMLKVNKGLTGNVKSVNAGLSPSKDAMIASLLMAESKHISQFPVSDKNLKSFETALTEIKEEGLFDLNELTLHKKIDKSVVEVLERVRNAQGFEVTNSLSLNKVVQQPKNVIDSPISEPVEQPKDGIDSPDSEPVEQPKDVVDSLDNEVVEGLPGAVEEPESEIGLGLNYESSDEEEAVERVVNDHIQSLEDEDLGYDLEESQSFESSNDESEAEIESTATFKKDEQVEVTNDPHKNDYKEPIEPIEPLHIKDLESDIENEIANSINEEKHEQNKKTSRKSGLRR